MTIVEEAGHLVETVGVRALPGIRPVRIGGDDARAWLNGQVTNDLREPHPGAATYALQVDLHGRVVTDMWVLDRGEDLVLLLPASLAERALALLDAHIVMEDVEIEVLDGVVPVSAQGPRAGELGLPEPGPYAIDRLGRGGWETLVPAAEVEATLARLAEAARTRSGGAVSPEGWELARLRLGHPAAEEDFAGEGYPQEAGLQHRAVSFTKGCYVGQEPVVMLEHRGKPPRRLVHLALNGGEAPGRGDAILTPSGEAAGKVTSAVSDPGEAGTVWALGYVRRALARVGSELRIDGRSARVLRVVGD